MPKEKFRFSYRFLDDLGGAVASLGLAIPLSRDVSALTRPVPLPPGSRFPSLPNALCVQPMEGCDADAGGSPTDLTFRRYRRFASGGAGLIWFEAVSVVRGGRGNLRQLWLHEGNLADFTRLVEETLETAGSAQGGGYRPYTVLQLGHSGRFSRPAGKPEPLVAQQIPALDALVGLGEGEEDYPLVTDGELEAFQEDFVRVSRLARDAGFDAVDIKACHGYLLSELVGARLRPGPYGGSFENRTRFLVSTVERIKREVPGIDVAVRLQAYDGIPPPPRVGRGGRPGSWARPGARPRASP